jgi:hypothetical protein
MVMADIVDQKNNRQKIYFIFLTGQLGVPFIRMIQKLDMIYINYIILFILYILIFRIVWNIENKIEKINKILSFVFAVYLFQDIIKILLLLNIDSWLNRN